MYHNNQNIIISGFISVSSAIRAKSRVIYKIALDVDRYNKVMKSGYHYAEKKQYRILEDSGMHIDYVTSEEFATLCPDKGSGGIAAITGERIYTSLPVLLQKKNSFLAVLDGIEDPYNLGFAIRTLYAAGVDALVLPATIRAGADAILAKSSAGASELLPTAKVDDLTEVCNIVKETGYTLVVTDKGAHSRDVAEIQISRPICLVFGGEKRGVSATVKSLADHLVELSYPRAANFSLPAVSAVALLSFAIAGRIAPPDDAGDGSYNHGLGYHDR